MKSKAYLILLVFVFTLIPLLAFSQETVTITTYYPSPYGSYRELTSHRMKIGTTYSGSGTTVSDNNLIVEGSVGIGTTGPNTALDLNGAFSVRGMAAPALSPTGQGRIYFDSTANKFKMSENAGAYTDLGGGVSGSGTANYIPLWTSTTSLGNSLISQSGANVNVNGYLNVINGYSVRITSPGVLRTEGGVQHANLAPFSFGYSLSYSAAGFGDLAYVASSRRYKDNISLLTGEDYTKILNATPLSFHWKADRNPDNRDIGFTAEDFDAIGLKKLVVYDAEGRPDNIQYDKITIYNLEVLKAHHKDLENIKSAMTFTSGNVGIGTTPTYQLQLSTDSAAKPSTNTWTIASDARVKKDIRPYTNGLSIIKRIKPVWFKYNGKAGLPLDNQDHIGVIGQEIVKVAPYTVNTFKTKLNPEDKEPTELLNFNSHAFTFDLINAVKELDANITKLSQENQELKRANKELSQELTRFKERLARLEARAK